MRKTYTKIILVATITLSVVACRKDSPNIMNPEDLGYFSLTEWHPSELFINFWNAMNTSYLFWDIDPTDWDSIYTEYAPKFKELDMIYAEEDGEYVLGYEEYIEGLAKNTEYYEEITANLIDSHFKLELWGINVDKITPAYEKVKSRDYYHDTSTMSTELTLIWNALNSREGEITNIKRACYDCDDFTVYSAEIDGIALLSLTNFYFTIESSMNLDTTSSNATMYEVLDNFFKITRSENFKGAIFDLRNNKGGYTGDLNAIFNDYVNKDNCIPFMTSRQKNGPGRLDYSPYITTSLVGTSSEPTKSFPIVSLINLYSASMAEVTSLFIKEFNPNSIWIGERSFGAQSSLTNDSNYAGGIIENEYMYLYTPSVMSSDINKVCHEGIGLIPDIEMLYNDVIDNLEEGTDLVMNRAIEYLNNL